MQNLPFSRFTLQNLLTGFVSQSFFLAGQSLGRLVTLKWVQPHVTRPAFLGHTHHLLVHSQLRPRNAPSVPTPRLHLGTHSYPAWSFPSVSPAGSPGAPTCPRQAVCSVRGRPPWCQVEETRGTRGAPLMQHRGQHPPTDLITLDGPRQGLRGPAVALGSHLTPAPLTGELLSSCAACKDRTLIHMPLPAHGALVGSPFPEYGAHLGRHPGRAQRTGTVPIALVAEHPQPEHLRAGSELTNSSSWTGL